MFSITGADIIVELVESQEGEAGLAELHEELRLQPRPEEGMVYDHEIYVKAANAAAILDFLIDQAKEKHLELLSWKSETDLHGNNFIQEAVQNFCDGLTDRQILIDEIPKDSLRFVLTSALEESTLKTREILNLIGHPPEYDPGYPAIEKGMTEANMIVGDFIKKALN